MTAVGRHFFMFRDLALFYVPRRGFEPRYADSESAVLPLDDLGVFKNVVIIPKIRQKSSLTYYFATKFGSDIVDFLVWDRLGHWSRSLYNTQYPDVFLKQFQ